MGKRRFKLINDKDGNDNIELDATDGHGALHEALTRLGWSLTSRQSKPGDKEPLADCILTSSKPMSDCETCKGKGDCKLEVFQDCQYNPANKGADNDHFCPKCGQHFAVHNDDGSCIEGEPDPRIKEAVVTWKGGATERYSNDCWGDLLHQIACQIENDWNPDLIQSLHFERPSE